MDIQDASADITGKRVKMSETLPYTVLKTYGDKLTLLIPIWLL
jgi:hypothetical protein